MTVRKIYSQPQVQLVVMETTRLIASTNSGVGTGASLGDSYNSADATYSRGQRGSWDDSE